MVKTERRRGGREVYRTALEMRRGETHREFESHPLRSEGQRVHTGTVCPLFTAYTGVRTASISFSACSIFLNNVSNTGRSSRANFWSSMMRFEPRHARIARLV